MRVGDCLLLGNELKTLVNASNKQPVFLVQLALARDGFVLGFVFNGLKEFFLKSRSIFRSFQLMLVSKIGGKNTML